MMRKTIAVMIWMPLLAACSDLGEFSTDEGEIYRGDVIQGTFIRQGFGTGTKLTLSFHVDRTEEPPDAYGMGGAGVVSTTDGRFENAGLEPIAPLPHDQLSQLDFPGGRLRSYLFFAKPSGADEPHALVVVSLMEDSSVQVRILRGGDDPLFGVFHLQRESVEAE